jgi:tRNA 2-selenouridine synthase
VPQIVQISTFLNARTGACIIDVRTPKEFEQGHIPGAFNIPLFTNEERAIVGTLYKQEGKQNAILKGLELVGPKMAQLVTQAQTHAVNNTVYVHCWRGGMRSGSVAWLYEMYGFKVFVLHGGYKAFRNYVLSNLKTNAPIQILGGRTGSGKTHVLHALAQKGEQVIDLEKLAKHKGSAFGSLGEEIQPTQEQFENELAIQLYTLSEHKPVWIEDESRLIGNKIIPAELWDLMRKSPVVYTEIPLKERVNNLITDYGKFSAEELKTSILKISKKLGPEQTKYALEALSSGDLKTVCEFCLRYYDKTYDYGLQNRKKPAIHSFRFDSANFEMIADTLIKEL